MAWLRSHGLGAHLADIYVDYHPMYRGRKALRVSLRDNRDKSLHDARLHEIYSALKSRWPVIQAKGYLILLDDLP